MVPNGVFRGIPASLILAALLPCAVAQQGGGTGTGGGGTGGGTGGSKNPPSSSTSPSSGSQSQSTSGTPEPDQKQWLPYVTGTVVMDDGTPPPTGVVIERVCGGRPRREAYLNANGFFSFQIGAQNAFMLDASSSGDEGIVTGGTWAPTPRSSAALSGFDSGSSNNWIGCELRAQLPGYRSSTVILRRTQMQGQMLDVGAIVLCSLSRIQGTTVSATSLLAPKEAKKAYERADKALRKQKYDEAAKEMQTAVDLYPKYAAAWFRLGQLHQHEKRATDARLAFSKALEADRNYVSPYFELARLAGQEQKWQEVADLTDRGLALDPIGFPDGYVMSALANYNLNNLDAAERSARKAQRLDVLPKLPQGYLILASIFQRREDAAGEAEHLRNYLKYAPATGTADRVRSRLQELEKAGAPKVNRPANPQ